MKKWEELKKGDSIYMLIDRHENLKKFNGWCVNYIEEHFSEDVLIYEIKIENLKFHNPYKMDTPYIEIELEKSILVEKSKYGNLDSKTGQYFKLSRNDATNQEYYLTTFEDWAGSYYDYKKPCYLFKSKEDMIIFLNDEDRTIKARVRAMNKAFDEIDKKIEEL